MKHSKLMDKYALSEKGAKDFIKANIICAISDVLLVLPAGLLYMYILQIMPGDGLKSIMGVDAFGVSFYIISSIAIFVLMIIVEYLKYNAQYTAVYRESGVRRMTLAEKLRRMPLSYFGKKDLADLTSTLLEDSKMMEQVSSHQYPLYFGSMYATTFLAVVLFVLDWRMALACVWVIPVAFLIVYLSRKTQGRANDETLQVDLDLRNSIQECLECARDIRANHAEKSYHEMLEQKLSASESKHIYIEWFVGVFVSSAQMVLKIGLATTAVAGTWLLSTGDIHFATFLIFMIVVTRLYDPLSHALLNLAVMIYADSHLKRLRDLNHHPIQTGIAAFEPENMNIVFENVAFSYQDDVHVLNDISFEARQGEVTALVGPSGGGKSTVARLAARFWDIQNGRITLGGIDIGSIDPEVLLKSFSIVFQDVTLFKNTIMENIRIGRSDASDAEVMEAAAAAQCNAFISRLPEGYQTMIGENGATLSGGERQRISIARAILKDAPVILLDEATASLDIENETLIQEALSRLIRNKTVMIIAHRMRTVAHADKIVVIKDGTVAEQGRPDELMEKKGEFYKMVSRQKLSA
ncbi:MAG: ABC transporter ATP-binding protein [Proteobacteria bacterium]|nr:ABC transporter ATP-binding protein [Pseudomonadota bacterium]